MIGALRATFAQRLDLRVALDRFNVAPDDLALGFITAFPDRGDATADPHRGHSDAEHGQRVQAQPLDARTFPNVLIAKPGDFYDRGPRTANREDHRGDDERGEYGREEPAGPLVSLESSPDPPHESSDRKYQHQTDRYRERQGESALSQLRPHALDV
jgi:hypothetical protein